MAPRTTDLSVLLGRRIRQLRHRRGFTQEQLGEIASIAPKYLSSVERGLENPTVRVLEKLAMALDLGVRDLFDFEGSSRAALRETLNDLLDDADEKDLRRAVEIIRVILR